jgi:hypothetical protein
VVAAKVAGDVAVAFPLPVARASPPPPERVGPGPKPPVAVVGARPRRKKVAKKAELAPLVGENFPK